MLGYPGAGKTTIARELAKQTGAVHIWADHERNRMFRQPTHSKSESDELYEKLNTVADQQLAAGKSVVYDTNFSYYADRQLLRAIAAHYGVPTIIVWVTTPRELAERRAVHDSHQKDTRVWGNMSHADFKRIADHLEPPHSDETVIAIDGSHIQDNLEKIQTLINRWKPLS